MTKISKIKIRGITHEIKDNEAYVKPASGIPASDIAEGVIPDVSAFITKSVNDLTNYYTKAKTEELIGAINQFKYEIAASTSVVTNPQSNILYLIGPTGSGSDKYEEYVYTSDWVKIGDTSIDLSGYVTITALNTALANYTTTADLTTLLAGKQDTINDLSDIRSGAVAGATAYQKPVTGIPASDIATGVIPDISGKQDTLVSGTNIKTINNESILGSGNITIETRYPVNNQSSSSFNATVENYYRFTSAVGTMTITLPAPSDSYTHSIFFKFTTGSSPAVTFSSSESIIYYSDFAIEASTTYEINALYNGTEWIVAFATIE